MKTLTTLAAHALLGLSLLAGTLSTTALAQEYTEGKIAIDYPWSRPTPPGVPMGVGYMAITNHGDSDVTLIDASTSRAKSVSIHESTMKNGTMSMRPLKEGLTIPGGETVELKPHSYHLMLEKLQSPLKEGESIPLTLNFEGAADMDIRLDVKPLDGGMQKKEPGMDHSGH
ncbi:copper chaperone PCu(A)C [Marinobacter sp. TBZ242]|uniref:Copper chaperone PCu(A)C n=1 Tax=Marinobacter azerbaijanicus TaxID=3050455 RepID=A0ABT7I9X0_9GAMM|nr:copper chaperone PCu(A)C [Marinobacter sp. TBZ242]MDL0430483.1 copper chaperone PCu(A)C [Marinobacter sp. TBZ242]